MHVSTTLYQFINSLRKVINTLGNRQLFFQKKMMWPLLTIIHNLACLLQPINMVGTQSEEDNTRGRIPTHYCVPHRSRIIHHTKRINRDREMLLGKAFPNTIGKARPYKKQLFKRLYQEVWTRDIYNCTEVHDKEVLAATDLKASG